MYNDTLADGLIFRTATPKDLPAITEILKMAVKRMLEQGKQQWNENYPNETHIQADIENGTGYMLDLNGKVVAYGAVVFDGEPAYSYITGAWLADRPYVVVHRLAVSQQQERRGLGRDFLKAVEHLALSRGVDAFRVDTNYDNYAMLHLLEKSGFSYCGEIYYEKGSRKAFEKLL